MKSVYLKRKIDKSLKKWLRSTNHSPALVIGVRQCGKTASILEFANNNFENVVYINFWNNIELAKAFDESLEIEVIVNKIKLFMPNIAVEPYKTIFIFDEIQECPRARLALKNFKLDGKYEVIASGSYVGVNIDIKQNKTTPIPVGYEDIIKMTTLDFEEFLWARGYSEEQISLLEKYYDKKEEIPSSIHSKLKDLFSDYISIGGYPEVVTSFVKDNDYKKAYDKNLSLIEEIKADPKKRIDQNGNSLYTNFEISRIQNAFELISSFNFSDNERFIVSKIIGGNGNQKRDAINYLVDAKVAFKAVNVSVPALPLKMSSIVSQFKLFYSDIGLLTTSCGYDTIVAIKQKTLGMNKGFIYESVVAESLYKNDIPLFYFRKNSGLEIDLVVSYQGFSTLIEVKSKNGNAKSSKTVMAHPEHYGPTKLVKFGDYNIGYENEILTLPYYLTFMFAKKAYIDL